MIETVSIIIPAHNEADYIGPCLAALLNQIDAPSMHIIVAANACADETVAISTSYEAAFQKIGSALEVIDLEAPGKTNALNSAEARLSDRIRLYLDADVICDPALVGQIASVLANSEPHYATGTLQVTPAKSRITRAYARLWKSTPFVKSGAVGAGFFAVNAAGRARWGAFPNIISDDTFVRLNFSPEERSEVPAKYHWPMIEGFWGLVKVRRRQDAGVAEVRRLYPHLMANDQTPQLGLTGLATLAIRHPISFLVYLSVHLTVRTKRPETHWTRGR